MYLIINYDYKWFEYCELQIISTHIYINPVRGCPYKVCIKCLIMYYTNFIVLSNIPRCWKTLNYPSLSNRNMFTAGRLHVPFDACADITWTSPSSPGCTSTTLSNGHWPRFPLSSLFRTKLLILNCSFCAVHFYRRDKDGKYSCNQFFQKWSGHI